MSRKTALITGVGGQDGSYLAEALVALGYRVVGTVRTPSGEDARLRERIGMEVVVADIAAPDVISELLGIYRPNEFYNFAAYTSGAGMFDEPVAIGEVNGIAVARTLEAIRRHDPALRFCQASSSEMFGHVRTAPQNEETPFVPRTPYGAAKLYAHSMTDIYRKRYGLFACSAILFNHESRRRREAFVSRRISRAAARVKIGLQASLELGDLDARRDWGFAGDYVQAMRLMLQQDTPDDYVVASGRTHSVGEMCEIAFRHVELDFRDHVVSRPDAARFDEPVPLVGDAGKARARLGWTPTIGFEQLIKDMVDADLAELTSHNH